MVKASLYLLGGGRFDKNCGTTTYSGQQDILGSHRYLPSTPALCASPVGFLH